MRENDPTARGLRRELTEARDKKLIGNAMEPIPTHAIVGEAARQGKGLRQRGLAPVEGRVETRDLRLMRRHVEDCSDRRQVMRLVQRRQRGKFAEFLQHLSGHDDRLVEMDAAMDNAVAEANDFRADEQRAADHDDFAHGCVVIKAIVREFAIVQCGARGANDSQMRIDADAFDLTLEDQFVFWRRFIDRELDARRTGVDDRDAIGHIILPCIGVTLHSGGAALPARSGD